MELEEVVEVLLTAVELGEDASGSGAASGGGVEEHGFLDPGQGGEQLSHGEVEPGLLGLADHEPGDLQGEDAVEDVDPDFLVGEVVHG